MYRQYIVGLNISLEKGTENVPNDKQYHIIQDGEIIYSHSNEKKAMAKFAEHKPLTSKDKTPGKIKKHSIGNEIADRLLSQQTSARINKSYKKGGRKGLK